MSKAIGKLQFAVHDKGLSLSARLKFASQRLSHSNKLTALVSVVIDKQELALPN